MSDDNLPELMEAAEAEFSEWLDEYIGDYGAALEKAWGGQGEPPQEQHAMPGQPDKPMQPIVNVTVPAPKQPTGPRLPKWYRSGTGKGG